MPTLQEAVEHHANGRQKGRDVPPEKLYPFTFEGTGRTVQIRKISSLIRDEVNRAIRRDPSFPKEPEPPTEEIDYGDRKIAHANRSHPIYLGLMREWRVQFQTEVGERLFNLVVRRAVVCEIDAAAVAQARADMAAVGVALDEYDDQYVYVAFVCVGPQADYQELLDAVFNRAMPSQEAVQAHKDSFRGDDRAGREREEHLASEPGPDAGQPADSL